MSALVLATSRQTTDTPVWWLFVATAVLASATVTIAVGAFFALRQLKEVRQDRHVRAFLEIGNRWQSAEMTEALQMSDDYTADELAEVFARHYGARDKGNLDPRPESDRKREAKDVRVLLRVPNYFEDSAMIARVGALEHDAVDDYLGGLAAGEWKKWGTAVKKMQSDDGYAWSYEEFEGLAKSQARTRQDDWPARVAGWLRGCDRLHTQLSSVSKDGLPPV